MPSSHDPEPLADLLLSQHRQFLSFLERRLGDRDLAEDVLQAAFVKGLEKGDTLRQDESAVAWFYRLLRNAIVDRYRYRDAERRALERLALDEGGRYEPAPEIEGQICRCVDGLLPTLPGEQAAILRAVDLDGERVVDFARRLGISPGAARVRLHRARKALRQRLELTCRTCADHGCLDCDCGRERDEQSPPCRV